MRKILPILAILPALAGAASPSRADPPAAPPDTLGLVARAVLRPSDKGGFLDDPMAFDSGGAHLAYVRTDESSFCEVAVYDLARGSETATVDLTGFTLTPERLVWLPGGRLAVVSHRADADVRELAVYDTTSGKLLEQLGPATDFGFPRDATGAVHMVAFRKEAGAKGGTTYTVDEYSTTALAKHPRPIAHTVLDADADGLVARLHLVILFWEEDYGVLVARAKGQYDSASDMRRPDSAARWDVLTRRMLSDHDIKDVIGYAELLVRRAKYPGMGTFLDYSEDLRHLDLVRSDDTQAEVQPQLPLVLYDHTSLRQEIAPVAGGGERLYFSLTVDPVNPRAVDRRKADKDLLDLYEIDPGGDAATAHAALVGRVPAEGRPFRWVEGGGHLALLRKHVGFDRGGDSIEVYDLPSGPVTVTQVEIPAHPSL